MGWRDLGIIINSNFQTILKLIIKGNIILVVIGNL
jgi:hypothetical protein